jgi:hypothetical protein
MGRVNKKNDGVFVELIGSDEKYSAFDVFINNNNPEKMSDELSNYVTDYKSIVEKYRNEFNKLSILEEIIMQLRSKESMDIKLSIAGGGSSGTNMYIYARTHFYRKEKVAKDIRVVVDPVELWQDKIKTSVEDLRKNKEFMDKAIGKLTNAMTEEINKRSKNLKKK